MLVVPWNHSRADTGSIKAWLANRHKSYICLVCLATYNNLLFMGADKYNMTGYSFQGKGRARSRNHGC